MSDVTLVISDLGAGGTQRVVTNLANTWSARGIGVCVITLTEGEADFFSLHSDVRRVSISNSQDVRKRFGPIVSNLKQIANLRRALQKSRGPTVVAFVAATNVLTILATLGLGKRVIISERNDPSRQSNGRIWDMLRRGLYRRADLVTANSHGAVETLAAFVPRPKLAYVPNPLLRATKGETGSEKNSIILTVGRLVRQKAQGVIINAFSRITDRLPGWRLVIVGEGELGSDLRDLSRELGIGDKVKLVGRSDDTHKYFEEADIFVLSSHFEGTPNALLEAMSFGIPSIVSDASPGPLEVVHDGVNGLVFRTDDVDALSCSLEQLAGNRETRSRLGEAGRISVTEFEVTNAIRTWDRLLSLDR